MIELNKMEVFKNETDVNPSFSRSQENDPISRRTAIDVVHKIIYGFFDLVDDDSEEPISDKDKLLLEVNKAICNGIKNLPVAQPETCEDKLKEIADALSEKMCYMNTCPNERDIILSYLGHKRSSKNHCNTDCWNEKCESYHYETKQQPEPCELCSNLEKGDTLYQSSDWDGGIGFDYIWDIQYCPKCGRRLE